MKIAVTGASGQLGRCLLKTFDREECLPVDLPHWDITADGFTERLAKERPDLVIHAAAMTNVDGCALDEEQAMRVNAWGTDRVAEACSRCGADMVYISTNEVFSGESNVPYGEDDATGPINAYARSKQKGEQLAARRLDRLYIVRVAWLYAPGGVNFPSKMIALANRHGRLKVVTDEVANPTYAPDAAEALQSLVATGRCGTYHLVNEGEASRFDFARAVLDRTGLGGIPIEPILRMDFQRPSPPPAYTSLRNERAAALGIRLRPWQEALDDYVKMTPRHAEEGGLHGH